VPKKPLAGANGKLQLSEHLPYLFKHIYSQLQVASAGHLARFGVSVAVWRILAVLWEHGELSHKDLADQTSIEVSSLSRVSKAVQRDGLIRRIRTEQDQRTVRVTLTDKGRALAQQIIPWALDCQAEIVGNLSAQDVDTLIRILHVIVQNLSSYATTDPDVIEEPPIVKRSRKSKSVGRETRPQAGRSRLR